jgi:hypothetical protein
MNAQGDACFPVNISSLGLPEVQNGANATIMVQFNGGDGDLFQARYGDRVDFCSVTDNLYDSAPTLFFPIPSLSPPPRNATMQQEHSLLLPGARERRPHPQ